MLGATKDSRSLRFASVEMTELRWRGREQQIPFGDDRKKGKSLAFSRPRKPALLRSLVLLDRIAAVHPCGIDQVAQFNGSCRDTLLHEVFGFRRSRAIETMRFIELVDLFHHGAGVVEIVQVL